MVFYADNESLITVCGINDGASEAFLDANPLVEFGNEKETTCQHCKRIFHNMVDVHDKEMAEFSDQTNFISNTNAG